MIYTITLNPALDYYINISNFKENRLNIPNETYKLAGGKGINVSKVLNNFNIDSVAIGFLGGAIGEWIAENLKKDGIKNDFTRIEQDTRINIKLNNYGVETEIAGSSPFIEKEKLFVLFQNLEKIVKKDDIVVISGSIPNSLGATAYKELLKYLPEGIKVIVDIKGEALKQLLLEERKIFLLKPNRDEISQFFDQDFNSEEELIEAGKKLLSFGIENLLISLGGEGSIFLTRDKVYKATLPKGELISSNGSGDSMVAGFIYGYLKENNILDGYRYGVASGTATAFSKGLTTFDKMQSLLNEVTIKEIY